MKPTGAIAACAMFALAACTTVYGVKSSGVEARAFVSPDVAQAYISLFGRTYLFRPNRGAAFLVAPGVAVTNAHNADFMGETPIIGSSADYDLLFFRTARVAHPRYGEPFADENVIAYGEGGRGEVRQARGTVRYAHWPIEARCRICATQDAFAYLADAGEGFSGGPVVDADSGAIVGITFGYRDEDGHRFMFAYSMARVRQELSRVQSRPAAGGIK